MTLRVGSLFSGVGGLDLAVEAFFGAETAWHCEFDPEPSKVLAARWPGVPNLGDVTAVKWTPDCPTCGEPTALYWRDAAEEGREYYCPAHGWMPLSIRFDDPDADRIPDPVEIMCGGFPCQDLSLAGRRAGMRPGTRSGLWSDFVRAIRELKPKVVVIENVRGLLSGCAESASDGELGLCPRCVDPDGGAGHSPNVRALGRVLGDLSALGFDAEWHGLPASDVGAPHGRFRVFVLAYAKNFRHERGWPPRDGRSRSQDSSGGVGAGLTLLPTPSASNANDGEGADTWLARRERVKARRINGNGMGMPLAIAVQLLPTPTTQPETGNGHARNLGKEVKLLPTPTASEGEHGGPGRTYGDGTPTLGGIGRLLPTPRVASQRSSRSTMLGPSSSSMSIEQAAEVAQGILPREFESWDEVGIRPGGAAQWGDYEPAVRLWESITRPAPAPTLPDGKGGNHRLAAAFPEWMMGYPAGWVTDILDRNPAIKACGNGVVPQQAYAALGILWPRIRWEVAA